MQEFFDIPNDDIRTNNEKGSVVNEDAFFQLPMTISAEQSPIESSDDKLVRVRKSVFEGMKAKIVDLSRELHKTKRQNEQFADFLMRVTYTLRDVPDKQTELKVILDFLSKFITFKDGKFQLEVMSLMMSLGKLPKQEFASLVGAINFQAWSGFHTEGVLEACRDYGMAFPDMMPLWELVKTYIPPEILEKLNK